MGLGNIVTEARKRLGITQEELSRLSGVSRIHVSRIELGKGGPPKLSTLAKLAVERGYTDARLDVFCSTANRASTTM